ncbi:helix-turn-helix domain-containing protein [Saccharopolyspora soli]|uniref:helix-turn-helix domain-containing protein n=1 Tax=Saccharopolyspora soli TaxID=2926618 RepID=UPI002413AF59|nr:helix-turn-helix transcriptional regulator [Saccharopolyspora soli]
MAVHGGPTVRRRRLAAELRRLREVAGVSWEKAIAELDFSRSKLSRIETARSGVTVNDVRAMCGLYGVSGSELDGLLELAKQAKKKGWWHPYTKVMSDWFEVYIGLESEAAAVQNFEIDLIPGLLQTEEYARAIIRSWAPDEPDDDNEQRTQLRKARQSRLIDEAEPLKFWAIISEAAISQQVGGADVMRNQLKHLVSASKLPNVTVQVLPFRAGAHASLGTGFSMLSFPDLIDPDVVYLEFLTGSLYLEEAEEIERYTLNFDHLRATALDPRDSTKLLTKVAREM